MDEEVEEDSLDKKYPTVGYEQPLSNEDIKEIEDKVSDIIIPMLKGEGPIRQINMRNIPELSARIT